MLRAGIIDEKTALKRMEPQKLDELLHPVFDKDAVKRAQVMAKGLPASPGAAAGQIVFFADDAEAWAEKRKKVVMVRIETSPEDLRGMSVAQGILTARGGMTSHAAVVARGMGKCCVSGAGEIKIDYKARTLEMSGKTYKEGDWISLNGSTGEVYDGQVPTVEADMSGDFAAIMNLAEKYTKVDVRTNADTPKDASVARKFGAKGIGLCRTEHMFFEGTRIKAMREMILAKDEDGRRRGRVCENVVVDGCTVFKGHGGFVVGSEMSGGVRNVSVSNCQFLGTDVGLRFKSKRGRGGDVENIWIRYIAMMDIPTEPITFNLYYGGKSAVEVLESGEKVPAKVEPLPVDETTPCFRNIHVYNLVCAGARRALFFNGIPEMPIDGIVLEDIDITSKLGAEFIYSKNISMKNVNIRNTEGEKVITRFCEGVE